jgi:hypothetical protein
MRKSIKRRPALCAEGAPSRPPAPLSPEWAAAFVAPEVDAALDAPPVELAQREWLFKNVRWRNGLLGVSADELWRRNLDRRLAALVASQAAAKARRSETLKRARNAKNSAWAAFRDGELKPEVLRLSGRGHSYQQIEREIRRQLRKRADALPEDDPRRSWMEKETYYKIVHGILDREKAKKQPSKNPAALKQKGQ